MNVLQNRSVISPHLCLTFQKSLLRKAICSRNTHTQMVNKQQKGSLPFSHKLCSLPSATKNKVYRWHHFLTSSILDHVWWMIMSGVVMTSELSCGAETSLNHYDHLHWTGRNSLGLLWSAINLWYLQRTPSSAFFQLINRTKQMQNNPP